MIILYSQEEITEAIVREAKEEGSINTLTELVKKGILTFTQAAKEVGMSVSEFEAKSAMLK